MARLGRDNRSLVALREITEVPLGGSDHVCDQLLFAEQWQLKPSFNR
jgi:hypothetical protein